MKPCLCSTNILIGRTGRVVCARRDEDRTGTKMGLVRAHDRRAPRRAETLPVQDGVSLRPSERMRTAREAWVRIPGKHRNKDAAWDALGKHDRHAALAEPA
jgi:hypothetical protein